MVKFREVTLSEDQWIYLQNKLESIIEIEKDDKLEVISATIFLDLVGILREPATEEEIDKAKVLHGSVLDLVGDTPQ